MPATEAEALGRVNSLVLGVAFAMRAGGDDQSGEILTNSATSRGASPAPGPLRVVAETVRFSPGAAGHCEEPSDEAIQLAESSRRAPRTSR